MRKRTEPFERAVRREQKLRARAVSLGTGTGMLRLAMWWYMGLGAGWAIVVAAHWLVLDDPRWLAVLHTIVFVLVVGVWLFTAAFVHTLQRRRPDWFDVA